MTDIEHNITASELFTLLNEALDASGDVAVRLLHETLTLTCHYGLRSTHHGFGNLSSQVDSLCKQCHVSPADTRAIQQARRDGNSPNPLPPEQVAYDCRALSLLVSAVFQADVPATLTGRLPATRRPEAVTGYVDTRCVRCIVKRFDERFVYVEADQGDAPDSLRIDLAGTPDYIDLSYLTPILREGMQLNLLDCELKDDVVIPRLVVVEPDYLLDISTLSACFEDYGHHPLLYTLQRMKPKAVTQPILLGNLAGSLLDDVVNNADFRLADTLKNNFREQALGYATCLELDPVAFKRDARSQADNIRQAVADLFSRYDREDALLEPSFVSERLGLQGRVDLMTRDMRLLVEQKSGRNMFIEWRRANRHGSMHLEKHYVQVLLYWGVLTYNFGLSRRHTDIRLLYSKYPLPGGLLEVEPLQKLFHEAMRYRNEVVALEYDMAQRGFDTVIDRLTPDTLNVAKASDGFYRRYKLPELLRITTPLHTLSPLERDYFCRMMTFVMREQQVGKVGTQQGVAGSVSDLWNMPLQQKRETGNIYTGLTITRLEKSTTYNGYDTLTLAVPGQSDDFLPNFRRGDMIYLYAYADDEVPDVCRHILFRGTLTAIRSDEIVVHLSDGQQNARLFDTPPPSAHHPAWHYAVEHAGSDASGTAAIRSLYAFITSPQETRDLLLGQRAPRRDDSLQLSRSYDEAYDDVLLKAKQARDYYLLVGPPGTGKTSLALHYLVEEELATGQGSLLLMAYTNRAVDEICAMLADHDIDFIRMGSEFSCDERFRPHLLSAAVEDTPRLGDIRQRLMDCRVIVSTTSTMLSRTSLYTLKDFSLTIVDEASQILEPGLVGLLHGRFILMGDYKQLPAVVQQEPADSRVTLSRLLDIGLTDCRNSLFERLIRWERHCGRCDFIGVLHRQGRMHPDIAEFPSRAFYREERLVPVGLPHQSEPTTVPRMVFIPSEPCRSAELSDQVNTSEAVIVARELRRVYEEYGEAFDAQQTVGVIVPYRNQIAMIRCAVEQLAVKPLEAVTIDTVERYQGSQRDVIIYSFTVQRRYQLDFLTANSFTEDGRIIDRKLNVAITRARRQLVLTGNERTLRQSPVFRELIDHIKRHGGYQGL